jgi:hypothetical protein
MTLGPVWETMSLNMSLNAEQVSAQVLLAKFPNDVTFRRGYDLERLAYVYFCKRCDLLGMDTGLLVSRQQLETRVHYFEAAEMLHKMLYEHAKLHSPFCRYLEEIIIKNKLAGFEIKYPKSFDDRKLFFEEKKRMRRLIRIDYEDKKVR